ncbi:dTDP-4-dehydrorhamnose 3,5-epimerase [Parvibaculum sp.]|jgi:dTDP-4-dehydrorhamnose 3,5-epimerase|uniref:dTDP-4-dehydrorhamnose 3,5-epimerase n=1 Tax=Parvibaculum sp. TaxID=2024848 RepID=UPI002FDA0796
MIELEETAIPDVKILRPKRFGDARGYFSETFNKQALAEAGIEFDAIQDNESLSASPGTIRGLHFQKPDAAQAKLVRVLSGSIFDVAIDLRRGSPSYGRHVGVTLSADDWRQLLVPKGFAHGFCTLAPDTRVFYKVDAYYSPELDAGLIWNDPDLAIEWPAPSAEVTLSEKDARLPRFSDFDSPFDYSTA